MTVKVRERPKGSGRWWIMVDWHQRRVAKLMPDLKRALETAERVEWALDTLGEKALEMFREPSVQIPEPAPEITVLEFAKRWANELEKRDLKHSTRISYISNLKHHIIPDLGEKLITELDYAMLKSWVIGLQDGTYSKGRFRIEDDGLERKPYSRDSIRIMVITLRAMMGEAAREKLIPANPVQDLAIFYRKQRQDRVVRRSDVYPLQELHAIEKVLDSQRAKFIPDAHELFLTMSRTGMRVGEACGLRLTDLDTKARTIEVQRNIPSGTGHLEETTKGKVGHRTVDISKDLREAIISMLARRRADEMAAGERSSSLWLFRAPGGGPVDYGKLYDDWVRANRLAGVRFRSPHSLRHTYASASLARGEDLAYVSRQLGHANPAITLAIYTHFMPRKRRRISNALDREGKGRLRTNEAQDGKNKH